MTTFPSLETLKYLFVLYPPSTHAANPSGASYCSTEFDPTKQHPDSTNPFGNPPFPGNTYAGGPNWLAFLVKKNPSPLYAYNYAVSGHTVQRLKWQVTERFLPLAGKKPEYCPWESGNSLFISWIGINDCGMGLEAKKQVKELFEIQELLYEVGARNFLFFNLPPIDRTPAGAGHESIRFRVQAWNKTLQFLSQRFLSTHPDINLKIYDALGLFNRVLDEPYAYGFKSPSEKHMSSEATEEESVWYDELHPTSEMHRVLAEDLYRELSEGEKNGQERTRGA